MRKGWAVAVLICALVLGLPVPGGGRGGHKKEKQPPTPPRNEE